MSNLYKVQNMLTPSFLLDNATLIEMMVKFEREIKKGLSKAMHDDAEVKSFVTYVRHLPKGNETGKFLALDLGGTNFRVLYIELRGEEDFIQKSKIYSIPNSLMVGKGEDLFDYIAECLADYANELNVQNDVLPLGFTFSFPVAQKGLTKGVLIKWTKGFKCSGVVEENVVELLQKAIEKRGDVKILICAILNDTVGTLMSCAWFHQNCKIGVILGTGSNACYVEKAENAELYKSPSQHENSKVVINLEWGNFGAKSGALSGIRTSYDDAIDRMSMNPSEQTFEKMLSGMYLGEIARLIMVDLIGQKMLFGGVLSESISKVDSFPSKYLSDIEDHAGADCIPFVREILNEFDYPNANEEDCMIVRFISECVTTRSAYLVSAAVAVLLLKIGNDDVTIGFDGSLYRYHPRIHSLLTQKIQELIPKSYKFQIVLSEDGSGRGAAVVAAVASHEVRQRYSDQSERQ